MRVRTAANIISIALLAGVAVLVGAPEMWGQACDDFDACTANDMCWYPRSNKISWRGLGVIGRIEALEYGDGEPDD